MPWCIKKCPYCDFNSHKSPETLPEDAYIAALLEDLDADLTLTSHQKLQSIFIGGGTPSLLSVKAYETLLSGIQTLLPFPQTIEITLEANPSSIEQARFSEYRQLGINRLSIGIQSFNDLHLKSLGRVHDQKQAINAIHAAQKAGFNNFNLDLMYGLPNQSIHEGLDDLKQALDFNPTHLSWYQLTLEPNTLFYKQKPKLPDEDLIEALEQEGYQYLNEHGFERYEISAYCRNQAYAQHNLNYWHFGDYLGIGAGAHGKITNAHYQVCRTQKNRQPQDYLNPKRGERRQMTFVDTEELSFEYMLNASRLEGWIEKSEFTERTGLPWSDVEAKFIEAEKQGLIALYPDAWQVTSQGRRYTNNLQSLFLKA